MAHELAHTKMPHPCCKENDHANLQQEGPTREVIVKAFGKESIGRAKVFRCKKCGARHHLSQTAPPISAKP